MWAVTWKAYMACADCPRQSGCIDEEASTMRWHDLEPIILVLLLIEESILLPLTLLELASRTGIIML